MITGVIQLMLIVAAWKSQCPWP